MLDELGQPTLSTALWRDTMNVSRFVDCPRHHQSYGFPLLRVLEARQTRSFPRSGPVQRNSDAIQCKSKASAKRWETTISSAIVLLTSVFFGMRLQRSHVCMFEGHWTSSLVRRYARQLHRVCRSRLLASIHGRFTG